jgi:hypothetical protein
MTQDMIEKFVEKADRQNLAVNIHFKERNTVSGIFIRGTDYEELKNKNFWRIVSQPYAEAWGKTGDTNLARIYNGASFTRLTDY